MKLTALHKFGDDDLNPKEFVIYRARLNFFAFLFTSKVWIFLILVGFAILILALIYGDSIGFMIDPTITWGIWIFALIFLLYGGYRLSIRFIDWLYDEDIITNQRIIDYNQEFLFAKEVSTASMKSVEDVILVQKGILKILFDYGTLDVQTSASAKSVSADGLGRWLLLEDISKPKAVQHLIDQIVYRVKKEVSIDAEELLISCGLINGDLNEYFVVKKTGKWRLRVKKLLGWDF